MERHPNLQSQTAHSPSVNLDFIPSSNPSISKLKRASSVPASEHRLKDPDSGLKSQSGAERAFAAAERAQKAAQEAADVIAACTSDRARIPNISILSPEPQTSSSPQELPLTRLTESALFQHLKQTAPYSLQERVAPESVKATPQSAGNRLLTQRSARF